VLTTGTRMVKGRGFKADRIVGHAAQAVQIHQQRAVDEVVLLDVTATREGRGPNLQLVSELAGQCFSPLSVGGGIRNADDVRDLLRAGADKVVIGTGGPRLMAEVSEKFGRQAVVASVDVKDGRAWVRSGTHETRQPAVGYAVSCAQHGAGEILLQSIDRDGTMQGYDLDLIREVSSAVSIPVVASGGCGKPEHALEALRAGADAVAVGAMLLFTDHTPRTVGQYLKQNGVEVRL
jgi:cyclase